MNYVEHLWQEQFVAEQRKRTFTRFTGWTLGILVSLSLAAYLSREYWYPYINAYL